MVRVDGLLEFGDLAAAERVQQHVQPLEVGADQTLQDLLVQQLHHIVDVLAQQNGHAQLDRPVLLLDLAQLRGGRVREELQAALIEIFIVFLAAIIGREGAAQVRVDLGVVVGEHLQALPYLFKQLEGVVVLAQLQSLFSDGDLANKSSVCLARESPLGCVEELDCLLEVCELPGYIDSDE